jgi:hypothetical protein
MRSHILVIVAVVCLGMSIGQGAAFNYEGYFAEYNNIVSEYHDNACTPTQVNQYFDGTSLYGYFKHQTFDGKEGEDCDGERDSDCNFRLPEIIHGIDEFTTCSESNNLNTPLIPNPYGSKRRVATNNSAIYLFDEHDGDGQNRLKTNKLISSTVHLDDFYKSVANQNPDILSQYYISFYGYLQHYPAIYSLDPESIFSFDPSSPAGQRHDYMFNTMFAPKTTVVIVDFSGATFDPNFADPFGDHNLSEEREKLFRTVQGIFPLMMMHKPTDDFKLVFHGCDNNLTTFDPAPDFTPNEWGAPKTFFDILSKFNCSNNRDYPDDSSRYSLTSTLEEVKSLFETKAHNDLRIVSFNSNNNLRMNVSETPDSIYNAVREIPATFHTTNTNNSYDSVLHHMACTGGGTFNLFDDDFDNVGEFLERESGDATVYHELKSGLLVNRTVLSSYYPMYIRDILRPSIYHTTGILGIDRDVDLDNLPEGIVLKNRRSTGFTETPDNKLFNLDGIDRAMRLIDSSFSHCDRENTRKYKCNVLECGDNNDNPRETEQCDIHAFDPLENADPEWYEWYNNDHYVWCPDFTAQQNYEVCHTCTETSPSYMCDTQCLDWNFYPCTLEDSTQTTCWNSEGCILNHDYVNHTLCENQQCYGLVAHDLNHCDPTLDFDDNRFCHPSFYEEHRLIYEPTCDDDGEIIEDSGSGHDDGETDDGESDSHNDDIGSGHDDDDTGSGSGSYDDTGSGYEDDDETGSGSNDGESGYGEDGYNYGSGNNDGETDNGSSDGENSSNGSDVFSGANKQLLPILNTFLILLLAMLM